jgi:RIO-like serine/threonine protein kinase
MIRTQDEVLRQAAFALLLRHYEPVPADDLGSACRMAVDAVRSALDRMAECGLIDRDNAGRVTGSDGLSLTHGSHRLRLHERTFRTWCAYDALGIAGAVGAEATIDTSCAVCAQPIRIVMHAGRPDAGRVERLWLAGTSNDLRTDFCAPTVLLCCAAHAETWGAAHDRRGAALTNLP